MGGTLMENFLNKDALIELCFAAYGHYSAKPLSIFGKVTSIDNDFVTVEFNPNSQLKIASPLLNTSGRMLINKNYLISITLL